MGRSGAADPSTTGDRRPWGRPWDWRVRGLVGFLVIGVIVLALAVWAYAQWRQGSLQWKLFATVLGRLDFGWLAAASGLALATYFGRALRWRVLMRPVKQCASLGNLFVGTAIGFTAIVLFGRAGEVVRPYVIARKEAVPFSSQLGALTVERLYDLLASLALFGYALTGLGGSLGSKLRPAGYLAVVLAGLSVGLLAVFGLCGEWTERRLLSAVSAAPAALRLRAERVLKDFLAGLGAVRSLRAHAWLVLYTVAEWLLIGACCWCLFRGSQWTMGLGWGQTLAFVGWVSMGSIVQIPGVGGGMQIVTTVVLSEVYGLPVEASLGIAVALWCTTLVVILPFGFILGLREGVNWLTINRVAERGRV